MARLEYILLPCLYLSLLLSGVSPSSLGHVGLAFEGVLDGRGVDYLVRTLFPSGSRRGPCRPSYFNSRYQVVLCPSYATPQSDQI